MVFGWGKKKNQEIKHDQLSKKEISFSEISKITENSANLRLKTLISESTIIQDRFKSSIEQLAKIAKALSNDDLKVDDIDKNLRVLVVRGKTQVIESIEKECKIKFSKLSTEDDVFQLNQDVSKLLKKIGDVLGRQTRVIHIFAKKYAGELKKILSDITTQSNGLSSIVQSYINAKNNISEIHDLVKNYNEIKDKNSFLSERNSELESSIDSINSKIKQLQEKLSKIESSKEYLKFRELEKKKDGLYPLKQDLKHEIDSQFTKISRPLGKYVYVSSLDKSQKEVLEKLIANPYDALIPQNKDTIIIILQAVKKSIQSNSISVKDVEKSYLYLDETSELIDNYIGKISSLKEKESSFIQEQSKIFDSSIIQKIKEELSDLDYDKSDTERKILDHKKEIDEYKSQLPSTIAKIENLLKQISGTEYTITK